MYGKLILNGTVGKTVNFTATYPRPEPGRYQGIIFMPGSSGTIDHANIADAINGITIRGRGTPYVIVKNSVVANCSDTGISIDVGHLVPTPSYPLGNMILSTVIRNCSWAIKNNGIDTYLQDCEIRENSEGGIYLGHDGKVPKASSSTLQSCYFYKNGGRHPN